MTAGDIEKAIKSIHLCSGGYSVQECEKCPYYKPHDRTYSCVDDRYADLVKILEWALSTHKTIESFIRPKE